MKGSKGGGLRAMVGKAHLEPLMSPFVTALEKTCNCFLKGKPGCGLIRSLVIASAAVFCYAFRMKDTDHTLAAALAKAIAALCVRNTFLEDLHSGTTPSSQTGDYSDVKVVTPYGEIPWQKLSRLSDDEMKRLMKEIVNKLYTFLRRQADPAFLEPFLRLGELYTRRWDAPEIQEGFVAAPKRSRGKRHQRKGGEG